MMEMKAVYCKNGKETISTFDEYIKWIGEVSEYIETQNKTQFRYSEQMKGYNTIRDYISARA